MLSQKLRLLISDYLASLKNKNAIHDADCCDVREVTTTWEDLYPSQPARLAAIAANERWGSGGQEELWPVEARCWPYHRVTHYYHYYPSDLEHDYRGSSDSDYDPGFDMLPEGCEWRTSYSWTMAVPETKLVADIYVKPVKPLEYIVVKFVVPGGNYKDMAGDA